MALNVQDTNMFLDRVKFNQICILLDVLHSTSVHFTYIKQHVPLISGEQSIVGSFTVVKLGTPKTNSRTP